MTETRKVPDVVLVPVDQIDVVNPRARSRRVFLEMLDCIAKVGLKRPITVARRDDRYDLVCGQGRLEAFRELGQASIPAIVIEADAEDCLVMGLVENLARRQHQALELFHDIVGMQHRGNSDLQIARKTGLSIEYTRGVLRLLKNGEARLLQAVESGVIPVSVAIEIAEAEEVDVQRVLQDAYEKNVLRGSGLLAARRLVERRSRRGKSPVRRDRQRTKPLSVDALIRTYQEDVDRKRQLVRQADIVRNRLMFITEALRQLFDEESFVNLSRAEGLSTLPHGLTERMHGEVDA